MKRSFLLAGAIAVTVSSLTLLWSAVPVTEAAKSPAQLPPRMAGPPTPAGYTFTTPTKGMPTMPYVKRGDPFVIRWTGGLPGPVRLTLIDYCAWTVHSIIVPNIPNNRVHNWVVPPTLPCGIYCVYIQNASGPPTNWTYSDNFAVTKP